MGKITACVFVLMVLAFAQVQPNKYELQKNKLLVKLLKKALSRMEEVSGSEEPTEEANNQPDMDLDIESLEYYYTLPFSNFIVDNALSRMMSPLPTNLTDVFQMNRSRVMAVQNIFNRTMPTKMMPESFAAAMTMETVPILFDARMACPSTVFNQFVIRLWARQYQKILADGEAFTQFNQSAVAVFPTFETMPAELKAFVTLAMEELRGALFNTTNIITLALELRDVAFASHSLYYNFYATKAGFTSPTQFTTLVQNAIMETDVRCHTKNELFGQHGITTSIFMNEWEDMETQDICYHIGVIFYNYIAYRVQQMPNGETIAEDSLQWDNLYPLCDWIRTFIRKDVFPIFSNYQTAFAKMKTAEFLGYFDFLDNKEMAVLQDVLARLGWPKSPAMEPTTKRSGNRLFSSFLGRNGKRFGKKSNFGRKLRNQFGRRKW